MVLHVLYVKADLDNVDLWEFPPHHRWCLDIKEPTSDEKREGVWVCDDEEEEVSGSRGTAHFLMKWPGAKKESQLTVVRDVKKLTRPITGEDSGEWVPVVGFDCRGLEPVAWSPEGGYTITSAGGTAVFQDVDLAEDWSDYDEDGGQAVGIYAIEHKFEVVKEKK
ncbi:hypothetical protein LEN26_015761 [Aphanomyces euteiches]|nr:hypothetical protein LEN26_015761 [Aphanomyces euteiches]KAH9126415.1 hypothetical protein AeMF1_003166 [Aphanomyces euteiches]KAH9190583.1 hypothetical protein AeNC1_007433 [Aphanomyces euteiches]